MVRKPTGVPMSMLRRFHIPTHVMPERIRSLVPLMTSPQFRHPAGPTARSLVELLDRKKPA